MLISDLWRITTAWRLSTVLGCSKVRKLELLLAHPGTLCRIPLETLQAAMSSMLTCRFVSLTSTDSDETQVKQLQRQILQPEQTIIGGFSLGARIAALLSQEIRVAGLLCLSYPFHRHGDSLDPHGLRALQGVTTPTLIVQGTRDSHGNQQQVHGMSLPSSVSICWLEDGNHRWQPRARAAVHFEDHIVTAAKAVDGFVRDLLSSSHD